ncbi:MAG TPA: bifunctional DNA-formamidopyrimidine glycosylase/DNA-(apurinic or apyrimidinic site) lyase [Longimicrobiaceae bacterium]|nr:bifunctional DNA-formamidopyrimidine glycosylase/DNA-(apurinic or apyrimidinic site) lyase [Longimicrobiaceae bacterium]
MPELPEVETIVRDLARLLPGAVVRDVRVVHPDLVGGEDAAAFAEGLRGATVREVTRRAKNILVHTDRGLLVVNLGMTGRLLVRSPDDPAPTHLGVRFALADGRELDYHDVRRFGCLQRYADAEWARREEELGVEPLSGDFTAEWLYGAAQKSRVAVKTWLMDQRRVVGVGNIYASEALFRARIDPRRPASSLRREEAARLVEAVREVLREAIDFRGTTLMDYRDAGGERGAFAERLRVYDREGEPCRTCGRPVRRVVQGGRSTFFCAHCQS